MAAEHCACDIASHTNHETQQKIAAAPTIQNVSNVGRSLHGSSCAWHQPRYARFALQSCHPWVLSTSLCADIFASSSPLSATSYMPAHAARARHRLVLAQTIRWGTLAAKWSEQAVVGMVSMGHLSEALDTKSMYALSRRGGLATSCTRTPGYLCVPAYIALDRYPIGRFFHLCAA